MVPGPANVILGGRRDGIGPAEAQVWSEVVRKVPADTRQRESGRTQRDRHRHSNIDPDHQATVVQSTELDVDTELGWPDLQDSATQPVIAVPTEAGLQEEHALVLDPQVPDDRLPVEDANRRIAVSHDRPGEHHAEMDEWRHGPVEEVVASTDHDRRGAMITGLRARGQRQDLDERRIGELLDL